MKRKTPAHAAKRHPVTQPASSHSNYWAIPAQFKTGSLTNFTEQSPWEAKITQLVKKLPTLYTPRRFINVFTRAHHWFLSSARWIQSTKSNPLSPRSVLILFSHLTLGLQSGLIPSGFPHFSSLPCVPHAPPISSSLTWST